MKKGQMLNAPLSSVVASLGHTDQLAVADAGLPIPEGPQRIDLALKRGSPDFLSVLEVLLLDVQVERVWLADEIKEHNPEMLAQLVALLQQAGEAQGQIIEIAFVSHEQFKLQTHTCKAVVRSGECSPYANVILQSGVAF
ncbi:D-ribose pyranase [Aliagarivorans marinus]|uniref:D-ribose pyranase n=1 Tax=Aliagarivorans marinus TaxID=561965 RepID=UPI00040E921B|nr:D-ribose pyranase [Aliagarivorans marinus]